jgi:hypothetical protein
MAMKLIPQSKRLVVGIFVKSRYFWKNGRVSVLPELLYDAVWIVNALRTSLAAYLPIRSFDTGMASKAPFDFESLIDLKYIFGQRSHQKVAP